jgi:hypothetical protein
MVVSDRRREGVALYVVWFDDVVCCVLCCCRFVLVDASDESRVVCVVCTSNNSVFSFVVGAELVNPYRTVGFPGSLTKGITLSLSLYVLCLSLSLSLSEANAMGVTYSTGRERELLP